MTRRMPVWAIIVLFVMLPVLAGSKEAKVQVQVEEVVTRFENPNNGAGPLWCFGAPLLFRRGDEVFVSAAETGKGVPPLCNTRWQLWRRDSEGWHLANHESDFVEREPCPLGGLPDGRLFLSANPSRSPRGTMYGAHCDPHVLRFSAETPSGAPKALHPAWADKVHFTEHSYRALAIDRAKGELFVMNILGGDYRYFPSLLDSTGKWHPAEPLRFPITSCYPPVVLRNRAVHVLAIGDIIEPVEEWRKLKYEVLKNDWDYVFRRLFYTFTPDVTSKPFAPALEVDTVEETAGHMLPMDLHVDGQGRVHLLYTRISHQYAFMRDKYFPGQTIKSSLIHVVMEKGKVVSREALVEHTEGSKSLLPSWARFHVTPDGGLHVILYATWTDDTGVSKEDNFLIGPGLDKSPKPLALTHPMNRFFTNTLRGGSEPSGTLDLYGTGSSDPQALRYARVAL